MAEEPKDPTPPPAAGQKPASDAPATPAAAVGTEAAAGTGAAKAVPPKPAAPSGAVPAAGAGAAKAAPAAGAGAAKPPAAHDMKPAPPSGPTDPPPLPGTAVPSFISALQAAIPSGIEQLSLYVGDWTVIVPIAKLLDVGRFLRDTPATAFDFCSDVTASDWPSRAQRFDVIYCLYSTTRHWRVRLKVRAGESDGVPSVSGLWPAANWLEREVYDLFGVNFTGHPDRRRILMPDDWQGFPQRKDYPLEGPGELLMENPLDWLRLKQAREDAEIE